MSDTAHTGNVSPQEIPELLPLVSSLIAMANGYWSCGAGTNFSHLIRGFNN
ncbi:MAG: hypothetical protein ACSLEN_04145 [Candidatus Malihini olakiniferum]